MQNNDCEKLLDVGIALSSTHDIGVLLLMILQEARRFTTADAGTLYLVKGEALDAEISQCDTFTKRRGREETPDPGATLVLPINRDSIAGAAAASREVVNIPDVQDAATSGPFSYNPRFDRLFDYSTRSNLAVPMMDRDGNVIGVLQLINAQEDGRIVAFDEHRVKLARALASQAAVAIRNAILTRDLRDAHLDTLKRLGIAAEWRDRETARHITRVAQYAATIAARLGWSAADIELIRLASPMHDVGKLGIPDAILHKPGPLTDEERAIIETHTVIGANIMARSDNAVMRWSREVALGHHEKWNGKGYPRGLAGEAIPITCRIVALADVYDALSSRRCYKKPFPHEKVMSILAEETGQHFDPNVVEAFRAAIDQVVEIRDRYADTEADLDEFRDYAHIPLEG